MRKSMNRNISMLIVLVLILTATVIPAYAASVSCKYCGSRTTYYGDGYDVDEYYTVCDNAPTFSHLHQDVYYYDDYKCVSCGKITTVYTNFRVFCARGNMAKTIAQ